MPWTAGTLQQRRTDAWRLFRQVPAITELAQLDPSGREQLRVSRLAPDRDGKRNRFLQGDAKFLETVVAEDLLRPCLFSDDSEPYMTLALAGGHDAGVSVAEVNLKFIWDVVSQIKVGGRG